MSRSTERIGRCGEFAVASQLCLKSDTVSIVPHGSHADILFEYQNKILKCQVKTSTKERIFYKKNGEEYRSGWSFDLRRGKHSKSRHYGEGGENSIDLYALYCLAHNTIMFIAFEKAPTKITFTDNEVSQNDSQVSLDICLQENFSRYNADD